MSATPSPEVSVRKPFWSPTKSWLWPQDGWLLLILLAVLSLTTSASIAYVPTEWVYGVKIVMPLTWIGMAAGYLVSQQKLLHSTFLHPFAVVVGFGIASALTGQAQHAGTAVGVAAHFFAWFGDVVFAGRGSNDNIVFLLMLAFLSYLLAYYTMWLVIHGRNPWLAVLVNGAVLLINIGLNSDSLLNFFFIFLVAAILMIVRFTLMDSARQWRGRGVRFSRDIGWDFMQAGVIFAIVAIVLANLLPTLPKNPDLSKTFNDPSGALQQAEGRFQAIFGGANGPKNFGRGVGVFAGPLKLQGKVDLQPTPILRYTPNGDTDGARYLISQTYDTYDGYAQWSTQQQQPFEYLPNQAQPASGGDSKQVTYTITFATAPAEGDVRLYIPGSEGALVSVVSRTQLAKGTEVGTAWESKVTIPANVAYTATGWVTDATEDQLRQVPFPRDTSATGDYVYDNAIIQRYVNGGLVDGPTIAPEISQLARQVTAGKTSMYDQAVAIEEYLHDNFKYSTNNPEPTSGSDATVYFLELKQGFCTSFASAMALMGRSLGMPTRIAVGYANGTLEGPSNDYLVRGTEAHAWPQVYFARYGWVDFEPTASFSSFARTTQLSSLTPVPTVSVGAAGITPTTTLKDHQGIDPNLGSQQGRSPVVSAILDLGGLLLILAVGSALFMLWWRSIGRTLPAAAAAMLHITWLGRWAGTTPGISTTALEFTDELSQLIPAERESLRKLGQAYSYERWDTRVPETIANEVPALYHSVRVALTHLAIHKLRERALRLFNARTLRALLSQKMDSSERH